MGRKPALELSRVVAAIERAFRSGAAPTIRELAHALGGVSTRTVHRYLDLLEQEGWIERWPGSRGMRLLRSRAVTSDTVSIPLVGEVPAGPLLLAEENYEGWVRLPRTFVRAGAQSYYLLRVRGDSMNRARVEGGRIENGDLVLVRQQRNAENGEVVVALVDGETTIKRFHRGAGYIVLKPDSTNRSHQPIIADRRLQIQGVVRRVLNRGSAAFE